EGLARLIVSQRFATVGQDSNPVTASTGLESCPTSTREFGMPRDTVWKPGDVILDLYEVTAVHRGGGMGLVYRVHHRGWDLELALTSPRPEILQRAPHKAPLHREAPAWAR